MFFKNEVTRLCQNIGSFKLPSGYKNYITSIRDHCALKGGPTSEKASKPRIASELLQSIQSKMLERANRYLAMMPQNFCKTVRKIEVICLSKDYRSWTISCPLCPSIITAVYDGRYQTTNFKRHLDSHASRSAGESAVDNENSNESLSDMSVSVAVSDSTNCTASHSSTEQQSQRQNIEYTTDSSVSEKLKKASTQKPPAQKAPIKRCDSPSTSKTIPVRKEIPQRLTVSIKLLLRGCS